MKISPGLANAVSRTGARLRGSPRRRDADTANLGGACRETAIPHDDFALVEHEVEKLEQRRDYLVISSWRHNFGKVEDCEL